MRNPILGMLSGAMTGTGGFDLRNFPLARLNEFMGLMRGRNPEQLVQEYVRQNNIGDAEYKQAVGMAQQVCRMFGIK